MSDTNDILNLAAGALIGETIGDMIFGDIVPKVDISDDGFFERTRKMYRDVGIDWNYNRYNYGTCLTC